MKKNIRIVLSAAVMTFAATGIYARQGGAQTEPGTQSDRRVEVSREYVPEIGSASKLFAVPDMTDTVALRPDFEYTISPNAWRTGFGVAAINPAKVSAAQYDPRYPFYLKAGGGIPGQSLLDLYITSTGRGAGSVGFYGNHYGQYGKIKNDLRFKAKGLKSTNSTGIFGKVNIGRRMALEGEIGFDYDVWARYGMTLRDNSVTLPEEVKVPVQSYAVPRAKITFGNDFTDLSYFNLRFGAEGYYMEDRDDNKEKGISAFIEMAKMFSVHKLSLKADFRGAFADNQIGEWYKVYVGGNGKYSVRDNEIIFSAGAGSAGEEFKNYYDRVFTVAPRYGLITEKFKLEAGADFSYNVNAFASSKLYIMPQAEITVNAAKWFTPFVLLDSRIINNSYYSMTRRNPYVAPGYVRKNTRRYDLRAGVYGSISSNFSYRLYAGASLYKNPVFFGVVNIEDVISYDFSPVEDKRMTVVTGGLDLDGRLSGSFTAGLAARFYHYSLKSFDYASGMPKYDVSLSLRYNCRDKFFLTASAKLVGDRRFYEYNIITVAPPEIQSYYNKESAAVDLSLEAEYRIKRNFGVFLQGNNLGGSKLYQFNHYPDRGASVSAGVKLMF